MNETSTTVGGGLRRHRLLVIAAMVIAILGIATVIGVARSNGTQNPPPGVDPVASDPADLIGTWRHTYIRSSTPPDSKVTHRQSPTLTFEKDGKWHGSDGCNGVGGTYDADPGKISAEAGPSTAIWCNNVPHVEVLTASAYFRSTGTALTLYDASWTQLASYSRVR